MNRKPLLLAFAALGLGLGLGAAALADPMMKKPEMAKEQMAKDTMKKDMMTAPAPLALGGVDPTSYFTGMGKPQKGKAAFTATHDGHTYRFVSAAARDTFTANPAAYAPQYGGYCAWAAAQGYKAPGDARFYRVVDGRLFLNFNGKVQKDWEKDIPGNIVKADSNWPTVKDEPAKK